jgi:hypothetical protein
LVTRRGAGLQQMRCLPLAHQTGCRRCNSRRRQVGRGLRERADVRAGLLLRY